MPGGGVTCRSPVAEFISPPSTHILMSSLKVKTSGATPCVCRYAKEDDDGGKHGCVVLSCHRHHHARMD